MLLLLLAISAISLMVVRQGIPLFSAISEVSYYLSFAYFTLAFFLLFLPSIHRFIQSKNILFISLSYFRQSFIFLCCFSQTMGCKLIEMSIPTISNVTFQQVNAELFVFGLFMLLFPIAIFTRWPFDIVYLKGQVLPVMAPNQKGD